MIMYYFMRKDAGSTTTRVVNLVGLDYWDSIKIQKSMEESGADYIAVLHKCDTLEDAKKMLSDLEHNEFCWGVEWKKGRRARIATRIPDGRVFEFFVVCNPVFESVYMGADHYGVLVGRGGLDYVQRVAQQSQWVPYQIRLQS